MTQIKCEAVVYESAGRGGLGHARHCLFTPKWNVSGRMFCTIHKNVETRRSRKFEVESLEPQAPNALKPGEEKQITEWTTATGKSYRVIQNIDGYIVEFRYETLGQTSKTISSFRSKRAALRWAEEWAGQ